MNAAPPVASSTAEFRNFLTETWRRCLDDWPETATGVGAPGRNDRWTDYSPEAIGARERRFRAERERFGGFDRAALPEGDQLNFDLVRRGLDDAETGTAFGFEPIPFPLGWSNLWMPMNQMSGVHVDASLVLSIHPKNVPKDGEDYVARLEKLPHLVDQVRRLLEAGLRRGYSPPRVSASRAADQVAALTPADPSASALLAPLASLPPHWPEPMRHGLIERARKLYSESVAPAFRELHDYLTTSYFPACRETIAATALPNGPEMYSFLVRYHTTTDLTPQQIHEVGLREVDRIRAEMDRVIQRLRFGGSFDDFVAMLRTDPKFYFTSADDLLDGYRAIAKKIDPELPRLFGHLPRTPYGISPVPDYSAPSTPAAYYVGGSPEAGRPGIFYANTYNLPIRSRWEMETLVLHEAVPGHHLQLALATELENVPEFRKYSGWTAFAEGWGLYAESLGEEVGRLSDPYMKFGQLSADIWRAVRLVVDTGMHALGWSREKAIRYATTTTGRAEHDITVEVDRYIVWPGQALAYKVGQLKFRELRERAEGRLGARFDVRRFHDVVLASGTVPLNVAEARVDRWIATELGRAAA